MSPPMDDTTLSILRMFTTALAVINALLLLDLALSKRHASKWRLAAIVLSIIFFGIVWYVAVGQYRPHSANSLTWTNQR